MIYAAFGIYIVITLYWFICLALKIDDLKSSLKEITHGKTQSMFGSFKNHNSIPHLRKMCEKNKDLLREVIDHVYRDDNV